MATKTANPVQSTFAEAKATTKAEAKPMKSAADILNAKGVVFGAPLEEHIAYILSNWTETPQHFAATNGRPARDGMQINLYMAKLAQPNAEPTPYRCFSAVLLRQLESIGKDNLPVVAKFEKRETQDGRVDETGRRFAAWSIALA